MAPGEMVSGASRYRAVSLSDMVPLWEPRPRQPFTGLLAMAIVGILGAEFLPAPLVVIAALWGVGAAAMALKPNTASCWALTALTFFALHNLRQQHSAAQQLSAAFHAGNRVVRATGVICSEPDPTPPSARSVRAHFTLQLSAIEIDGQPSATDALVRVAWAGPLPVYGDRVRCLGAAQNLAPPDNPGQFDFAADQRRRGVMTEIQTRYAADCEVLAHGEGHWALQRAIAARAWVQRQLERDLEDSPEVSALIASMVLGLHGATAAEDKLLFQQTGTLHLFAVSGLNVAMVGALTWFLLKPFRVGRRLGICLSIPILLGYAVVTGLSASCVRATVMGVLMLAAYLVDRRPIFYNSVAAAGFAILGWDTQQLFLPGFQFSFVLVFTIVWLAAPIERRLQPLGGPDAWLPRSLWSVRQRLAAHLWHTLCSTLAVTVAAWLGSLLFCAGYFHLFAPAALLANLCAVPIAFGILTLGLFSIACAGFCPWLSALFNNANWSAAHLLLAILKACALIPGGHLYLQIPRLRPAPACEITVLAVHSGGATHLRAAGRDWLWDCGSASSYSFCVLPYLRSRGVNWLDGLLLSHGDSQHLGGAPAVLADLQPAQIIDSVLADRSRARRAFHRELAARNRGKALYQSGEAFAISGRVRVRVLYPPAGLERALADDKTLVLLLECGQTRVLWMADSGFATEQWLLDHEPALRCDVLIKGQHEKDLSGTTEFLARVAPQAVVCPGPVFGHESASLSEWQSQLQAMGITLFRQDQCGAAQLEIDAHGWTLRGYRNAQILRSRAR